MVPWGLDQCFAEFWALNHLQNVDQAVALQQVVEYNGYILEL